ncbi:MAG: ABC transporter permease subunit [Actinomycetota bacterium]
MFAEAVEDADLGPTTALRRLGAGTTTAFLYGTLPVVAPRVLSLARYRWEVIVRESVVVGVVGAGGLGQLINEHLAARDFAAVSGAIGALIVLALLIDVRWSRLAVPVGWRAGRTTGAAP